MSNPEIVNTIHAQMGGKRFMVMTGAKPAYCTDTSITYKLKRNKSQANHLTIECIAGTDLYTMKFEKVTLCQKSYDVKRKQISAIEGVYFDMLQNTFTEQTGMYTSL